MPYRNPDDLYFVWRDYRAYFDLLRGWLSTVTESTAPNLLGNDNVSIAAMWAKWLGLGAPAAQIDGRGSRSGERDMSAKRRRVVEVGSLSDVPGQPRQYTALIGNAVPRHAGGRCSRKAADAAGAKLHRLMHAGDIGQARIQDRHE